MKHKGEWRPVIVSDYLKQMERSLLCRQLECGSAVRTEMTPRSTEVPAWVIRPYCYGFESSLSQCGDIDPALSSKSLEVICSGNTILGIYRDSRLKEVEHFLV